MAHKRRSVEEIERLLLNKRFERLFVYDSRKTGWHRLWLVRCDCGKEFETRAAPLFSGRTKSCGCFHKDATTKHGMSDTREQHSYRCMMKRCYSPGNKDFYNYGARGITVCERWRGNFINFLSDMGLRPEGKTLDRIDSNKGYSPENCKWSTSSEQARNTRKVRWISLDGEHAPLSDHCKRYGTCNVTIEEKVAGGLTYEEAFKELVDRRKAIETKKLQKKLKGPRDPATRLMKGKLGPHKKSTTGYKGVTTFKKLNKFDAVIHVNKKSIYIGRFETKEEAALAYNAAALKHFGPDAYFNEIKEAA